MFSQKRIVIISALIGVILIVVGILFMLNNKKSDQEDKTGMDLAKEYICSRELATDEYNMKSEYHIYADDNGNLIRNQFKMVTTYLTDELYQLYTEDSDQYEDPMTTYDPESRTVTVSSDYQYDVEQETAKVNFKDFKEDIEKNEFTCRSVE